MKKYLATLLIVFSLASHVNAQSNLGNENYLTTPPEFTFGIGGGMNFAVLDAYGRAIAAGDILRLSYGMKWGFNGYTNVKYGFGKLKNSRITGGFMYHRMFNGNFDGNAGGNQTAYNITSSSLGYEFNFATRSRVKLFVGTGLTVNTISGQLKRPGNTIAITKINNAVRFGAQVNAGYEYSLGAERQMAVVVTVNYNVLNLFNSKTDGTTPPPMGAFAELNDAAVFGSTFKKYLGVVSLNLGLNFYTGVKRVTKTRPTL